MIKDFLGLNGHFTFKPELYSPVCRLVRNYHNVSWDVKQPGDPITLPVCVNKVNWDSLYSKWKSHGFEVNACAIFGPFGPQSENYKSLWAGQMDWAEEYGYQMAKVLGRKGLVTSIEVGNEPGVRFDDALYRDIFERMAAGVRRGDPDLKILTCTVHDGPADNYHKNLTETFGDSKLTPLYDVLNVHVYAQKMKADQAHPWERSYPEDPKIDYLTRVDAVIDWRDKNAPGKEIWITEFGYDACSEAAMQKREGWFKKLGWTGVSELEQAQWLVRSLLCFAERDVERAYIYFYDDSDKAATHAAAGLTRHGKPKPAYWAVKQFYEKLGDFRFNRVLRQAEEELYAYEFVATDGRLVWVLWSPTGSGRSEEVHLRQLPSAPKEIVVMTLEDGAPVAVKAEHSGAGIRLEVGESPVYISF